MTQNNRTQRPCQNYDECIDCSDCVEGCPEGAISKVPGDKKLVFDWNLCTGCAQCAEISCPVQAIFMIPEPEDK